MLVIGRPFAMSTSMWIGAASIPMTVADDTCASTQTRKARSVPA